MTSAENTVKTDKNYSRKHEVIWYNDFLLYSSGCKSWPCTNINIDEIKEKLDKYTKSLNNDLNDLHMILNKIKEAIKSLDYSDARKETLNILQEYNKNDCINRGIDIINHKMQHIGKSSFFEADQYDMLMLFAEFNGSKRERYSREYDRILVTKSFRHLQYKTQIMINSASDDQRTRLLHSLEVQRIAKTLAIQLGANSSLAQTIAIGHDVGHAPFGHAGESSLSECLSKGCFGEFSHALQSVKVLNYIEKHPVVKRYGFSGLGLSVEVLSGILKHDTDTFRKNVSSAAFRLQYDCPLVLKYYPDNELNKLNDEIINLEQSSLTMGTLESQIVYWADKIAYIGHDWEEFVLSNHAEELLHDMNEISGKIGIVVALYEDNRDKIAEDRIFEYEKLHNIHDLLKQMSCMFDDSDQGDKASDSANPIEKCEALKTSLNGTIDQLLKIEKEMIRPIVEETDKNGKIKSNHYELLSRNEYKMLFDYFRVTQAWIYITDRIPEKYKEHNDIIYIIYRYLKDTISQRTSPCIETDLILSTREEIEHLNDQMVVALSLKKWKGNMENLNREDKKEAKAAFMRSLVVKLSDKMSENLRIVDEFKYKYYIGSKEVQHMTDKASMVVRELFDHFLDCPEMLPDECLEEYYLQVERKYNDYKILVAEYLIEEYNKLVESSEKINGSGAFNEDIRHLAQKTDEVINHSSKNETTTGSNEDSTRNKAYSNIEILERLNRIAHDLSTSDNQNEADVSLINKGRQRYLFDNEWVKQNKHMDPFKSKNHVSKTILARIVADYICSMTDRMAILKYNEFTTSSTSWTEKYKA